MATLVREEKYIKSDLRNNNNKFWYIEVYDDGTVVTKYGRVGDKGQERSKSMGSQGAAETFADKKIKEKTRDGRNGEIAYRPLNVVDGGGSVSKVATQSVSKSNLETIAQNQIRSNNPIVAELITKVTKDNAHDITSATGGQVKFNDVTGLFSTPLGVVTQSNIDDARNILVEIGDLVVSESYGEKLKNYTNDYLMLVPQDIGRRRLEVSSFWSTLQKVQAQNSIVDALQASYASASAIPTTKKTKVKTVEEQVFDVQLDFVEDSKTWDMIKKMFNKTRQTAHACQHLDVKRVYSVKINTVDQAFQDNGANLKNIWQLWHGTRSSNLLSILKGGLIIPPSSSSHCTGRMFGNGIYASDQSTKALNYAYGYWDRNRKDNNCFMFLLDMAMGDYHVPNGPSRNFPVKGTQSTFAKGRQSGVGNNEMIVYNVNQVNLKYLIEFSPNGK